MVYDFNGGATDFFFLEMKAGGGKVVVGRGGPLQQLGKKPGWSGGGEPGGFHHLYGIGSLVSFEPATDLKLILKTSWTVLQGVGFGPGASGC